MEAIQHHRDDRPDFGTLAIQAARWAMVQRMEEIRQASAEAARRAPIVVACEPVSQATLEAIEALGAETAALEYLRQAVGDGLSEAHRQHAEEAVSAAMVRLANEAAIEAVDARGAALAAELGTDPWTEGRPD